MLIHVLMDIYALTLLVVSRRMIMIMGRGGLMMFALIVDVDGIMKETSVIVKVGNRWID